MILGRPVTEKIAQGRRCCGRTSSCRSRRRRGGCRRRCRRGSARSRVPVDLSGSLAGMLRPGDHVDILGTFARGQGTDWATVTLLQNVLVLATGDLRGGAESERDLRRRRAAQLQQHHRLRRSRRGGAAGVRHAARAGQRRAALARGHRDRRRPAGQELRRHLRTQKRAPPSSGVTRPRRSRRSKPNEAANEACSSWC